MKMKKIMISLVVTLCLFTVLPNSRAAVSTFPANGWGATYTGTYLGTPISLSYAYSAFNSTCYIVAYTLYNATTSFAGAGLEEIVTRKVVKTNGMYLGLGNHTQRALPAEMSAGIGDSMDIAIGGGIGDASHEITGQGTLVVTEVSLNYWIASGTRGVTTQTVWLEKTTGMLLRLVITGSPASDMDVTMKAATNVLPPKPAGIYAFPADAWGATYAGTYLNYPVLLNSGYSANNATSLVPAYTLYNDTFSLVGSGVEETATRKVVKSNGMYLGLENHTQRALLADMTAGIGASMAIAIGGGIGDAPHNITGQGTLNVTGVSLNYWIANGTRDGANQTVWLEKTTGMLLRLIIAGSPGSDMDVTIVSATNIIPPSDAGIAGFDVWVLFASMGFAVLVFWRKKRAQV